MLIMPSFVHLPGQQRETHDDDCGVRGDDYLTFFKRATGHDLF